MDKVAVFLCIYTIQSHENRKLPLLWWRLRFTEQSGRIFASVKVAALLPKPVYIICKCNQTVWLHVSRCSPGKQPTCKMGLLRIISPSAALLRVSKWALVLPWQCWRWLRYEARTDLFSSSFICSIGSCEKISIKQTRSCNLCSRSAWVIQLHPGSSLDFVIICPAAERF